MSVFTNPASASAEHAAAYIAALLDLVGEREPIGVLRATPTLLRRAVEGLAEFSAFRGSNLRLLERASGEDLKRAGVHEERGEESVAHLMRLYAGHDLMHLGQLARIREAIG